MERAVRTKFCFASIPILLLLTAVTWAQPQGVGVYGGATGGILSPRTIGAGPSQLPLPANCPRCLVVVTDAATNSDCATGGGTAHAVCYSNGIVWGPLGGGGVSGTFTPRGAYSSTTTYAALDIVSFNGTAYVSVQNNNTNHPPDTSPAWWALPGPSGPRGPEGEPGGTIRMCEIHIWGSGPGQVLQDTDDEEASCFNDVGGPEEIKAVRCRANAGSPTVLPILTGGAADSILTGPLTCGTGTWAVGTLNGTPVLAVGETIDVNISSAGGVATNIRLVITLGR